MECLWEQPVNVGRQMPLVAFVRARVRWEEYCPKPIRTFAEWGASKTGSYHWKTCLLHLLALKMTFKFDFFFQFYINCPCIWDSILRWMCVEWICQHDGRSRCRSFRSRLRWQTVAETLAGFAELCNPSLLQLLFVSQRSYTTLSSNPTLRPYSVPALWNLLQSVLLNCYFNGGSHKIQCDG